MRWWLAFGFAAALGGCDRLWGLFPLHEIEPTFDATLIDAPPPMACPGTYTLTLPGSTSRYRIEATRAAVWTGAANACESESTTPGSYTHLWVISSLDEFQAFNQATPPPPSDLWIGYADRSLDGIFEWVTAEATAVYVPMLPPWKSDNPDHSGPGCVTYRAGSDPSVREIADNDCESAARLYICECDGYADLHRR